MTNLSLERDCSPKRVLLPRQTIIDTYRLLSHLLAAFRRRGIRIGKQVLGGDEGRVHVDVVKPQRLRHGNPPRKLPRLQKTPAATIGARKVTQDRSLGDGSRGTGRGGGYVVRPGQEIRVPDGGGGVEGVYSISCTAEVV